MNNTPPAPKASFGKAVALWATGCAALITVTQITPSNTLEQGLLSITALIGAGAIITAVHDHMAATQRADAAAVIAQRIEDARDAEISAYLRSSRRRDHAIQSGTIATYRSPEMLEALADLQHGQDTRRSIARLGANAREYVGAQ